MIQLRTFKKKSNYVENYNFGIDIKMMYIGH